MWVDKHSPTEIEDLVGFSVLFPEYLPPGYSLEDDYLVNSGGEKLNDDGTYQVSFQNYVKRQGVDTIDTVRVSYYRNDSYTELIDYSSGEVRLTLYNSTGEFPSEWYGDVFLSTKKHEITLRESSEDIFTKGYLPKYEEVKVNINGIKGEYWINRNMDQYGKVEYERACLSWNLNEYWLILTAGGEAILDSDEMIKIAESININ